MSTAHRLLPRTGRRRVAIPAVLAVACLALAVGARVTVAAISADIAGRPASVATTTLAADTSTMLDVVAAVGASSAGAGVLLVGATLVALVRRRHARSLPTVLGLVTLALTVGAVLAGVAAEHRTDFSGVAELDLLRTALTGLAVTSLPALVVAAVRVRARR